MLPKKHANTDKLLSQQTEPRKESTVPLPPGCKEDMALGNEPIADFGIGEAVTGTILEIKSIQTAGMVKPNNLITFNDEAYGRVKFWSSGALNSLLSNAIDVIGKKITIQRIEDEDFKKGRGRNWRIFIHQ
jgi:hypothetical protein